MNDPAKTKKVRYLVLKNVSWDDSVEVNAHTPKAAIDALGGDVPGTYLAVPIRNVHVMTVAPPETPPEPQMVLTEKDVADWLKTSRPEAAVDYADFGPSDTEAVGATHVVTGGTAA
jgi:hypothetical protein